jgi:hypothetical protein
MHWPFPQIPVLAEYRLDADLRARIAMVTRMMQAGFLRPAVVVLAGAKSNVARMESAWKAYLGYVSHTLSNAMMHRLPCIGSICIGT